MPLLLVTPDAEPLVGSWRAAHDWAARYGVPAHVTVRSPFLSPELWSEASLQTTLEPFLPIDIQLARLEDRPGALVILVEPDEQLWEIVRAVDRAWPSLPTHKGGRDDAAFHVTVVRTRNQRIRRDASEAIAQSLPMTVRGTEFWAAEGTAEAGAIHAVVAGAS